MTAAVLTVDTDEGNGTLYAVVTQSPTTPNRFQIVAGVDENSDDADWVLDGGQAVNAPGTQTVNVEASPGLVAGSGSPVEPIYYAHFVQVDAAGNWSDPVTSPAFTLSAGGDGGFSPDQLGAPPILWLKADELSGSDGDNIATFPDASGNGRDFTQATEADKPNLEVAELNGLNVLRFDKANTESLSGPTLANIGPAAVSIFYVLRAVADPGAAGDTGPGKFGTSGNANHYTFTDGAIYNDDFSTTRKSVGDPTPNTTAWNIVGVHSAAGAWSYWMNGAQIFSTGTNTVALSGAPLLGTSNGVQFWDGYIAEIVVLPFVPSAADREKIEGYLAHKWGITSVLDSGHTYKNTAPTGGAPSEPSTDPDFASVVLLAGFNGTDGQTTFTDESPVARTLTAAGDAQVDTAAQKFGTGSLLVDGTGDWVTTADSDDFELPGEFTIEAWVRPNLSSIKTGAIIGQWTNANPNSNFYLHYFFNSATVKSFRFTMAPAGNPASSTTLTQPSVNLDQSVFHHVAVDRDASDVARLYVDGVLIASATISGGVNAAAALRIGDRGDGLTTFIGWLDEVRVTKGVARYASDYGFIPRSTAFPRSA